MAKTIATWVLTVPVFGLFAAAGATKFGEEATRNFQDRMGYSDEFRIFIGLVELAGAVGVLVPGLAAWAAAGLVVIMAGAVYTHVQIGEPITFPAVTGIVCAALAWLRFGRAAGLAARERTASVSSATAQAPSTSGDRPAA